MANLNEIIEKIENFAPPCLASEWDNSGWQVFLENDSVNKVMIALSPTIDVINQAVNEKCDLIITHHPLMFSKINKINSNDLSNLALIKAIQNNIQIYSAHTNLDRTNCGIADKLAELFNLKNVETYEEFVKIGELEWDQHLFEFLLTIKNTLDTDSLKIINNSAKTKIRKIAVCPGSGGDFIGKLKGVDLYITSDIKYHTALEVDGIIVVDAGHLETERIILPVIKDLLNNIEVETIIAQEKAPWQIV